jgi:gamma-glutamyltranspeptidase
MVRIGSRKWSAAQIERLILLIEAGSSAASAAVALKRSITVVQTKARSLGKSFQVAVSRR